jgi:hypothetical protein
LENVHREKGRLNLRAAKALSFRAQRGTSQSKD